jgi:hypothetical protein
MHCNKREDGIPGRVSSKLNDPTCIHLRPKIEPLVRRWRRKKRELAPKHGKELASEMADLWLLVVTARINRCGTCWRNNQAVIPKPSLKRIFAGTA